MKKLLMILIFSVVFIGIANARPFLVCDVQDDVDEYILILNTGEEIKTPAPLHYDLKDLPVGTYIATVWAKKGVWRSKPSVPLEFTKPLLTPPTLQLVAD